jgi:hypothetical protein
MYKYVSIIIYWTCPKGSPPPVPANYENEKYSFTPQKLSYKPVISNVYSPIIERSAPVYCKASWGAKFQGKCGKHL